MKKFKFEIIWLTIIVIIMAVAYYKFGNKSAREIFDIKCPDLVTALEGEC